MKQIKDQTEWIPFIDYNKLDKLILLEICKIPYRLTGNHVRFIRLYLEKTLEQFAKMLKVKHSCIIHWEKQKDNIAKITWGTELSIRLIIIYQLISDHSLMELQVAETAPKQIDIDLK